jgi:hypothetical protein
VEQELVTLSKHMRSPPVFGRLHIAQSLVVSVVCGRLLYIIVHPIVVCLSAMLLHIKQLLPSMDVNIQNY